jgi:hypothetical protein
MLVVVVAVQNTLANMVGWVLLVVVTAAITFQHLCQGKAVLQILVAVGAAAQTVQQ